jgi:hypothetical protein
MLLMGLMPTFVGAIGVLVHTGLPGVVSPNTTIE